jgi:hypothetical protein
MKEGFEFVEFDFDAVWAAISRSTQLRGYMENLAAQVESQATALGRSEAYDEGYYADLFSSTVASAAEVRREFTDTYNKRRNRRRRGTTSRVIDRPTVPGEDGKPVKIKGDPDGSEYGGAVGVVANSDFKAVWVEYGSIAKGPRFIMSRAAEAVAAQNDAEWEPLYAKTHEQNTGALAEKISQGMIAKNNGGRFGGKNK